MEVRTYGERIDAGRDEFIDQSKQNADLLQRRIAMREA